jgi:DNA-directed RNA polymerase subunit RPC12/RpoP
MFPPSIVYKCLNCGAPWESTPEGKNKYRHCVRCKHKEFQKIDRRSIFTRTKQNFQQYLEQNFRF